MRIRNIIAKGVPFAILIGCLGLLGCDSPTSSKNNIAEEPKEEIASFGIESGNNLIDGQYIVVFKDDAKGIEVTNAANNIAAKSKASIKHVYGKALKGFTIKLAEESVNQELEALSNDPNVAFIQQDIRVFGGESQENVTWGLDRSDQRGLPVDYTYNYILTGDNVKVYIADSGINYSHVDFGGRASFGFDAYGGDGSDCHGHGTHVAGTVGGTEWGIAKDAELISVKMLDCDNAGTLSGVLAGIDWITENASGPAIVNMSIVTSGIISTFDNAIENSIAATGITYVIAGGNLNADACDYSPARIPSAITVGATSSSDAKASFSNYGSCIDLFAPGNSIKSAYIGSNTATERMNGTSMATPHVTGAAALYLQSNPSATPAEVESFIISNSTQDIVTNSNTPNNHLVYTLFDGSGNDGGGGGDENSAPDADFSFTANYLNVQFSDGSIDSDGSISSRSWNFGDGSSSSSENPSHSYNEAGNYTVTLSVTDNSGDSDSVSKTVSVTEQSANTPLSANFSFNVDGLSVEFDDNSSDPDGNITARSWNFGDGSTSSSTNPSHTYSQEGTYTVTLLVTDNDGDSDTVSKEVTVTEPVGNAIALDVNSYKRKGRWAAKLYWEGASSSNVEIYRNGIRITRTSNDGYYDDRTKYKGRGSLRYKVCESGTNTCSDEVTVYY